MFCRCSPRLWFQDRAHVWLTTLILFFCRTSCCSVTIVTEAITCTVWALRCLSRQRVRMHAAKLHNVPHPHFYQTSQLSTTTRTFLSLQRRGTICAVGRMRRVKPAVRAVVLIFKAVLKNMTLRTLFFFFLFLFWMNVLIWIRRSKIPWLRLQKWRRYFCLNQTVICHIRWLPQNVWWRCHGNE